ncbi:hypothetical protein ACP4OV_027011 [Aristida adscensionis]
MASPRPRTVSSCTSVTEQGEHVFEIFGYSKHRGKGISEYISSGIFSVGGYDWAIRFYPDGNYSPSASGCISVHLVLLSRNANARASCDLNLINQISGLPWSVKKTELKMLKSNEHLPQWSESFMDRRQFKKSVYLRDDHLTIQCIVTVRKERVSTAKSLNKIAVDVPPSNIADHLGNLLESEKGTDVTFSVGGECFPAHKIVLATRSPVFKAELYGPMQEAMSQLVKIEDMQPAVFRTILHFMYTDSLPCSGTDDQKGDANNEMIRHLLVAADRYAVDRLNLICQNILGESLDVETVGDTMDLAYQHNCDSLKDVCLEFITRPNVMDAVMATQGYKNLKASCPSALADAFEMSMSPRKT